MPRLLHTASFLFVAFCVLTGRSTFAQTTITLGASMDNTLYEDTTGSLSNGKGQYLFTGRTNQLAGSIRRGLLAFDIAGAIPAGSTITNVVLTLVVSKTSNGAAPVSLSHVNASWGEGASVAVANEGNGTAAATGDATWLHRFFNTTFWSNRGGDFSTTPSATQTVGFIGSYTWGSTVQMVSDVQGWLNNPATNFGWVLLGDETTAPTSKQIGSRDNTTPALRPALTVTFTPDSTTTTIVSINNGWNLVSLPRTPQDSSVAVLYPGAVPGSIYSFLTGAYTKPATLTSGQGYWAFYSAAGINPVIGARIASASVTVPSGNRWVLLGSVSSAIPVSHLVTNPTGSVVPGALYTFEGSTYTMPTTFQPGRGYWVFVNQPCTLSISQ